MSVPHTMPRKGTDPIIVDSPIESRPLLWLTFLTSITVISLIHGLLTPLFSDATARLLYSTILAPLVQIWGVFFYAHFAYPKNAYLKDPKHNAIYVIFSVIAVGLGAMRSFGGGESQVWMEGVYSAFINGVWCAAVWYIYTDQNNVNMTWVRYCVPPLYFFAIVYDIGTSFPSMVSLAVVTSTIWIVYSVFICLLVVFYDHPVDFFRRKINHVTKGWVDYIINNDGSYFSFFVFMLSSVGPGAGILLSHCANKPLYWDPTMKTLLIQFYSVFAINIAEVTTSRMSDSWIYRAFMVSFMVQLDIVQGALFLQTTAFDWNFLKMTMAVQFAHLFKSSSLKEAVLWLLGMQKELPYIDRPKNQIRRRISIDFRLEIITMLAVYVVYVFEKMSIDMSSTPRYEVTMYNSTTWEDDIDPTVLWKYTYNKCAMTCVGWRVDWGFPPVAGGNETGVMEGWTSPESTSQVGDALLACFLFRLIFSWIESRLVFRIYTQFTQLAVAMNANKKHAELTMYEEKETTVAFAELKADEFKSWITEGVKKVFMRELETKNCGAYTFMNSGEFGEVALTDRGFLSDGLTLRKDLARYVDDGKEFGVEVMRSQIKVKPPLKKTASEREKAGETAGGGSLNSPNMPRVESGEDDDYGPDRMAFADDIGSEVLGASDALERRKENEKKGVSPIESVSFTFLVVSLWFAVSAAVSALSYSTTLGLSLVNDQMDVEEA